MKANQFLIESNIQHIKFLMSFVAHHKVWNADEFISCSVSVTLRLILLRVALFSASKQITLAFYF